MAKKCEFKKKNGQPKTEPIRDPTIYRLGQQRLCEMLVEVMGA